MSKNQLRKMLFFETVLTNIISGSLAITFGFILSKIIDSFMQGINMYVEMFYDWKTVFGFMGIVFIVLLFTLIIPMRKLRKMNVVNEIKYE
jgi:ABC-type antimicrobial peptide transport system permease subunit